MSLPIFLILYGNSLKLASYFYPQKTNVLLYQNIHFMKIRLLALLFILMALPDVNAQHKPMNQSYQKQWATVDSLLNGGFPKSAITVIEEILSAAKHKNDSPTLIRAQLSLINAQETINEDSTVSNLQKMDQYVAQASGVEKAIWQSITAEHYWNYYQQNRWKVLQRTALAETTSDDIATWDAAAFFKKIGDLFRESVSEESSLQQIRLEQYDDLITKGKNTRRLRPTLYDLLAFRALDFFSNDEKELVRPAFTFQIEAPLWFGPADHFAEVMVKIKDGSSLHFQALQLYQRIIAFHRKDATADALIDADLQRLAFVYQYSVHPDKYDLYLKALQQLAANYATQPAVAQVTYTRIALQVNKAQEATKDSTKLTKTIPVLFQELQQLVQRFPDTEGGILAQNLIHSLQQKELSLQSEEVYIPEEPIKVLLQYKNVPTAFVKVYRVPNDYTAAEEGNFNQKWLKYIKEQQPVQSIQVTLPAAEDMGGHSTEIKIDALSKGSYLLVLSLKDQVADSNQIVTFSTIQVSNISLIGYAAENKSQVYVLHRKTGQPLSKTRLTFFSHTYNRKTQSYEFKEAGSSNSDNGGAAPIPADNLKDNHYYRNTRVLLVHGTDSLLVQGNMTGYARNHELQEEQQHTFFFTDRSIYRPGQTIYFKGILVKSKAGGRDNEVIAGSKTKVSFYDANGQIITTTEYTSNAFGAVSGSFVAPETGLTGTMRIADLQGSATISVEEYKRPKFFVAFDTLKGTYALNETVTIKGNAKAYAGNNIDGAQVSYRVVRRARFPYFWQYYRCGMPQSPEMEITNGTTTTDISGAFEITFETTPDKQIGEQALPVFTYTVHTDITDINGETRSGSQSVHAGYRSLQIATNINESSKPTDLDTINVHTKNLNNVFVPTQVHLRVALLKFPGMLRQRLWEKPDQYSMNEAEFRAAFPLDEYQEESNPMNWQEDQTIHQQDFISTEAGTISIPTDTWNRNGWYLIELRSKDPQGHEIIEKKFTHVWAHGKKEPVQQAFVVYANKESYQPGDTLELWLATSTDNPFLLRHATTVYEERMPIKINIKPEDLGGLNFSWLYVANNRVYTTDKYIDIPWSDKELQLEWGTHRDKLLPGAPEEWTLTIKGHQKEKVAAELLAGMYDASLDAFKPHAWNWNKLFPNSYQAPAWSNYGFGVSYGSQISSIQGPEYLSYEKTYDQIKGTGNRYMLYHYTAGAAPGIQIRGARSMAEESKQDADARPAPAMKFTPPVTKNNAETIAEATDQPEPQIRKNLQETAFFFPLLQTDATGNIKIKFTIPEALTEWKLMAFAHTKDWKTGYLEGKVKTQKDLMVQPNLPRFLRQNDELQISTKISNLSQAALQGTVTLELLDAATQQPLNLPFKLSTPAQTFNVAQGQSVAASWKVHIPESRYEPVIVRIAAKAGNFSDGEENTLPVITNRMLVTETLPMPVRANQSKQFSLDKLRQQNSSSLSHHALTIEFTGNPAWYAVQALPYLMDYPYECAEQTFNRFYANALAGHIVSLSPKVEQIFEQWRHTDSSALLSNLEKNQELKSALLEETPWVMEAQSEAEQKQRIAKLFDTYKLSKELKNNLNKLSQMQLPEGAFPWFKGMRSDRYITQYIVTGMGRLQQLGVQQATQDKARDIVHTALPYLDKLLKEDYERLLKDKIKLDQQNINYVQIQYLYMRSFFKDQPVPASAQKAFAYYKGQAAQYWSAFNPYMKAHIALALHRYADTKTPATIIAALKETSINQEEMGMYWQGNQPGFRWYEAPIETQSLLIETFAEIAKDEESVDALKVWLLKQKQTQNWKTTKATADACYALLLNGGDWLSNQPEVSIQLGATTIRSTDIKTEAGTGYFKRRIEGRDVQPEMGNISVTVTNNQQAGGVSWGAAYWQYFEDLDKITTAATPLSISKQLFIEQPSANGPVLTEIKDGHQLKVGDKVKVRLVLKADRDMEYVHLKDMRGACLEPVNVLSGYRYQGGIGYYESTKDVSSNFFIDYLNKGTYVFEYPAFVSQQGEFSNGIATLQCMYAPEFSSHSEGIRIKVE